MYALGIKSHLTPKAWPFIERWVSESLARANADQTPDDIRRELEAARCQLWLAWHEKRAVGCLITEICESSRGKVVNLVAVGGNDWPAWKHLLETVKAWARECGCVRMEATGRAGWERVLGEEWRKTRTTFEVGL